MVGAADRVERIQVVATDFQSGLFGSARHTVIHRSQFAILDPLPNHILGNATLLGSLFQREHHDVTAFGGLALAAALRQAIKERSTVLNAAASPSRTARRSRISSILAVRRISTSSLFRVLDVVLMPESSRHYETDIGMEKGPIRDSRRMRI